MRHFCEIDIPTYATVAAQLYEQSDLKTFVIWPEIKFKVTQVEGHSTSSEMALFDRLHSHFLSVICNNKVSILYLYRDITTFSQ